MEIHFYSTPAGNSPPQEFIRQLDQKTKKKVDRALERFKREGLNLMGARILEKVQGVEDIYELKVPPHGRIQYRFMCGKVSFRMYVLDVFKKKEQKLKKADIDRAVYRLKEIKSYGK